MGSKSSSGKGLAVFALIIGISGLGLGIYSFMQIQTGVNGTPSPPSPTSNIVGLWESLYRNMDNPDYNTVNEWLIEVGDAKIYNSSYVILNQSAQHMDTRFHLMKSGWYRVNIHLLLDSTNSVAGWYDIYVLKNGTTFLYLLHEVSMNQNLQVNRQFYISSDGNDYFELSCYNTADSFFIENQQVLNQLTIEYAGEY